MEEPRGPGGCFKAALISAGFDCAGLDIPEWVTSAECLGICARLGLETLPSGPAVLSGDRWYIVIVGTTPGCGHAQLMIGSGVPPEVVEIIPLPPKTVITENLVRARLTKAGLTKWLPRAGLV